MNVVLLLTVSVSEFALIEAHDSLIQDLHKYSAAI